MRLHKLLIPAGLGLAVLSAQTGTLSIEEKEEFLLKAKVIKDKPTTKGITSSRRATMNMGALTHDAHIQAIDISKSTFQTDRGTELNFRDSYKFNIAAYRLGRLLGLAAMIPPSVERKASGQTAAVTWWVDDVLMDEGQRLKQKVNPPDQDRWNQQMNIVRVFDQLICNTDRNLGNLLICKDWSMYMIDHTRAFRMRRDLQNPKNLTRCDRALLEAMRGLNKEQLTKELGRYLNRMEIDGLLARRDVIMTIFEQKIKEQGESAVLFDCLRAGR